MNYTHQFYTLVMTLIMAFTLSSCHEEESVPLAQDEYTERILNSDTIHLNWQTQDLSLSLVREGEDWEAWLQTDSRDIFSPDWCSLSFSLSETTVTIHLQTTENQNQKDRGALLILQHGDYRKGIVILQHPKPLMRLHADHVDVRGEGGDVPVLLHANVTTNLDTASLPHWLHIKEVKTYPYTNVDDGTLTRLYLLSADANNALGRQATLTLSCKDGVSAKVNIHQWPRQLNTTLSIHVDKPGTLGMLLGGDATQWAKVSTLSLSGILNDTDMQTLRALLSEQVTYQNISFKVDDEDGGTIESGHIYEVRLGLKHLDMGECTLVAGGDDYNERTIVPPVMQPYHTMNDNTLGYHAFNITRMPLESIVLPQHLKTIGQYAFYYSYHLQAIDIPASVTDIQSYAFENCQEIKKINIPVNSQLRDVGIYAFATSSVFEEIRLPASLIIDESGLGILGHPRTLNIHVSWTVPPVLKRYSILKTRTLYVPRGSGEAYRAAKGWKNAKAIVEE